MCNITEITLTDLTARHSDKESVLPINNLDVVNNKFIVKGNGCHSFHLAFFAHSPNPYVSNIHLVSTFPAPFQYQENYNTLLIISQHLLQNLGIKIRKLCNENKNKRKKYEKDTEAARPLKISTARPPEELPLYALC